MGKQDGPASRKAFPTILREIRSLIEISRHHVAVTANLALVNLYWNIGRIVTQDIQKNEKRGGYGEQLLGGLAKVLTQEYGHGYSISNLNDFRRFYEAFQILQTVSVKSLEKEIDQTPSDELGKEICQKMSSKSTDGRILQTLSAESSERILIDFKKHFRLGWSHYRLLLGQSDNLKRHFYFEQAAVQRWSVRELQRQIDGALFERVALSRDTRKLASLEKRKGPKEVVRYAALKSASTSNCS